MGFTSHGNSRTSKQGDGGDEKEVGWTLLCVEISYVPRQERNVKWISFREKSLQNHKFFALKALKFMLKNVFKDHFYF